VVWSCLIPATYAHIPVGYCDSLIMFGCFLGVENTLEQEYEERSLILRGKHELERRLKELEEQGRSSRAADEDALIRLRKDLKKTKALLRDAQIMLDRAKEDNPGKSALRALKNQVPSVLTKECINGKPSFLLGSCSFSSNR